MYMGNKGFLRVLMTGIVIPGFICIGVLFYNTCCLADIALNPYCTGDTGRIEELAAEFIDKYGEGVEIRRDEVTGAPIRVTGITTEVFEGKPEEIVFAFLSENASFFGIHSNDIEFSWLTEALGSKNVHFRQLHKGVPVFETRINVLIKKDGSIGSVKAEYYHCLDLDVVPNITEKQAGAVIMEDLGVTELFSEVRSSASFTYAPPPWGAPTGSTPYVSSYVPQKRVVKKPASTELLIYPKDGDAYLCWEFTFNLGESRYMWYYYVDAHTGEIVHSRKDLAAYSSGSTGDNSSQISNINPFNFTPSQVNGNGIGGLPVNYSMGYGYPSMGYGYPTAYYSPYNGFGYGYPGYGYPQGYQQPYYPYGWNPYGYQQTYDFYGSRIGYGYSPEDQTIMAAGGVPSWFEMPNWQERRPYGYGLPYGGYSGYVQSPPLPWYFQPSFGLANDMGGYPVRLPY